MHVMHVVSESTFPKRWQNAVQTSRYTSPAYREDLQAILSSDWSIRIMR
jgi:hypothetical protein